VEGALQAFDNHDLVIIHIEAPDEAGHGGLIGEKIKAIEDIDRQVVSRLLDIKNDRRALVMPDHPTPVMLRTHAPDPVPFMIWGEGIRGNGGFRFTESEAGKTGVFIEEGYKIMGRLVDE
jgi:2,3-bisphosphoglycerate-independent phosphoglycerate mutase